MSKKNIIFDLDDTLYLHDTLRSNVKTGIKQIIAKESIDNEQFWNTYHKVEPGLFHQFLDNEITGQEYMLRRYSKTLDAMSCAESKRIASELQLNYLQKIDEIEDIEHANDVLERLKKDGYKIFVLTNGPVNAQEKKLNALGIKEYFNEIYISEGIQIAKPNVLAFEHVLSREGLAVADTVVVGDSIKYDIMPAITMGLTAVYLNRNGEAHSEIELENMICIRQLRDVLIALEHLE